MDLKESVARIRAKYEDSPELHQKSLGEQLGGIPGDIVSSTLGLFGVEKSADQLLRERKYPVTSFLGSLVGPGGYYGGGLKLLKEVKTFDRAVEGMQFFKNAATSPIKTKMLQETARFGALEGARIGVGLAIPGGQSLDEMSGDAVLNLAFGAGVTGALGGMAAAGKRAAPLQEIFKDIDLNAPAQAQMRQLSEAIAQKKIDPKFEIEARNRLAKLGDFVRTQKPKEGDVFVGPTLKTGGTRINSLFRTLEEGGKQKLEKPVVKRLARTRDGYANDAGWQGVVTSAGLPEDWQQFAQFPRALSFKTDVAAGRIQNTVNQTMHSVGDGWYMTRENNDGLFVMAKRFRGTATKPQAADEWMVFKTDQPEKFRVLEGQWAGAQADHALFLARDHRPVGPVSEIYDSTRGMVDTLPMRKYADSKAHTGSLADMSERLAKNFGVDKALENSGEFTKRVKDFFVEYLAPSVQQFGRSPRAGRAYAIARATYDSAENMMRRLVYGEKNLDGKKTPFAHLLGKQSAPDGPSIKGAIDPLSEDEVKQFWNVWRQQGDRTVADEMFAQGKITQNVRNLVDTLHNVDTEVVKQIQSVQKATGLEPFTPAEGHYGLSRKWEGDNRIALRDAEDHLVAVAAGQSRAGAQREAKRLLAQLEKEGNTGLRQAEEFDITDTVKLPKDLKVAISSPAWTLENQRVRGFRFDTEAFTKDELLEAYANSLQARTKYMAEKTLGDLLADDIAKVGVEDPTMHRILVGRLNDLAGAKSVAGKLQEAVVDTVLGPILGRNSATKIVSATNKAMWHLELGAMRLAYPAMNMLTFVQTVLPEVAFVQRGNADILGKYYHNITLAGGKPRPGAVLDPIKLWYQGTKLMHSKDPGILKLVERGLNEGVIDPRFIEESTGSVGHRASLGELAKTGKFLPWLEAASEYLPAQSEKWSRLNAFTTGIAVGKDLLNVADDEQLYRFAKDFTDRTMFRYGMDSRPRVFTTPAGSMLGLFKNWMMHYVGLMLDYSAEGAMRNNWAPLAWQTFGTAAVGGVSALPLWAVANGFSQAMTGKSALVNGYETFSPLVGESVSDAIFYGLPALGGISVSSSAAAPLSNPMRDVTQMMTIAHWDRMQAAGKFFGNAMDHWGATGESPFGDPNTRDMFFRAFTPKSVYRSAAVLENNVINSLSTSTPVLKDVGIGDKLLFAAGVNPLAVEKAYAVSDELWKDQAAMKKAVAKYGEAMYGAYQKEDSREMEIIARRAMVEGVDLSSVERSAMARMTKDEVDMLHRQFTPEALDERMVVMGKKYAESQGEKPAP